MATHHLKTHPKYFQAVKFGEKPFEARRDDWAMGYVVGDVLVLAEFSPESGYTGDAIKRKITHKLTGEEFGIMKCFFVMGLHGVQTQIDQEVVE